ncbi:MAG: preprotein translocase subunit SecE [Chloroflexi bacterium]|nr:MAG: preprotein translocase subunit SecE [Chloroflexota bacterium]RLC94681.1 MAG: preprotein translocase subunit SecE [Chloroflexota bacterium]
MTKVLATKKRRFRLGFFADTIAELKKVVWPTRREAVRLTIMVLAVCFIMGLLLSLLDYGFSRLVVKYLLPGG